MKVRISQLWKIPAFCLAAGWLTFYAVVFLTARFAVIRLPGNVLTSNLDLSNLFYIVFFLITLLASRLCLRGMTAKERLLSATIQAVILLLLLLVQPGILLNAYITEWSRPISLIGYVLSGNVYVGAVLNCFAPYLLVPKMR